MKNTNVSIPQFLVFMILIGFCFQNMSCVPEKLTTERENFALALPDFSAITLDFPAEVILTQGDQQKINIHAQPEIFDAITKSVTEEEWLIDLVNFNGGFEPVTIEITMPTITALHTTSTGDIYVQDYFDKVEKLLLGVESTGKINYKGTAEQMDLIINGTGDVTLSGEADFLDAQLNSTGDLAAYDLPTQKVKLVSTGTGDAEIRVAKTLTVTMTSTGDVKYKGNPLIMSNISGTGDLKDEN